MKNCIVVLSLLFIFNAFTLFAQVTPSVDVTEDGVGIGIATPQEMLDVNGRIRDQSGIVMPVGSVMPFAGDSTKVPDGWLLCDGRAMPASDYPELFDTIGTNFGDGSTDTRPVAIDGEFNLPDLRGIFVRGLDNPETEVGAADKDPDSETRSLGDYQEDAFQGWQGAIGGVGDGDPIYYGKNRLDNGIISGNGHYTNHGLADFITTAQGDPSMLKPANDGTNGDPRTTNETRPKNVALNYIIKY